MLYVINKKPYIKVGNYYKMVKINKKDNEYNVVPEKGKNTTLEKLNDNHLIMSIQEYEKKYLKNKNNMKLEEEKEDFE